MHRQKLNIIFVRMIFFALHHNTARTHQPRPSGFFYTPNPAAQG